MFSTLSLILAQLGSLNFSILNFYLLPTRIWELFCGAILAKLEIDYRRRIHRVSSIIFSTLGIILIFFSFIYFDNANLHPSFITLVPVLGTAMIIWYSNDKNIITRILSSKFLVGLGLISYSLYLWHYPIFAFARITEIAQVDITKKIFLGITILLLSILSYFFIERPARNKSNNFKIVFLLLSILSLYLKG